MYNINIMKIKQRKTLPLAITLDTNVGLFLRYCPPYGFTFHYELVVQRFPS